MLQSIRDNSQGTIAKIIVAIIIIPFAFFGVESLLGGFGASDDIAEVNGENITQQELVREIELQKRQMRARMGENINQSLLDDDLLREPALERLIQRKLLETTAADWGLRVSDATVNQQIRGMDEFEVDGSFDQDQYKLLLRSSGFNSSTFRNLLRQEILNNQLITAIAATEFVTNDELQTIAGLTQQNRSFSYMTLPIENLLSSVTVDEPAMQKYYDENQLRYTTPEQVSIEYIEVDKNVLANGQTIEESDIEAQYNSELAEYESKTSRKAAHILVEKADGAEATVLTEVQGKIAAGEDFAELAKTYSKDIVSANSGGELGFSDGTVFPEAFETALSALEVGQVSQPVETDAGFHLIKLLEVEESERPTLEESRERITRELRDVAAHEEYLDMIETLGEETYSAPDLQSAAEVLGLKIKTTPEFSRAGGAGIASEAKVISTAFSEAIVAQMRSHSVYLVLLAGFLSFVEIPQDFEFRVLNIHPSLVPAFCGQGYYGSRVHEAAIKRGARVSGCTVHFADNEYDHGPIVVQRSVDIPDGTTPDELAALVFEQELSAYPDAVRRVVSGQLQVDGQRTCLSS